VEAEESGTWLSPHAGSEPRFGSSSSSSSLPFAGAPALDLRRRDSSQAPDSPGAGGRGRSTFDGTGFQNFSCFNRDQGVWVVVSDAVLWRLAVQAVKEGRQIIQCWSCGCSSGEEAYYLRMIWQRRLGPVFPELDLQVLGTDLCEESILAAKQGSYPQHSVQGLPASWQTDFFDVPDSFSPLHATFRFTPLRPSCTHDVARFQKEKKRCLEHARKRSEAALAALPGSSKKADGSGRFLWRLRDEDVLRSVAFERQDVTKDMPEGMFDIILSRYAVCLYLDGEQKVEALNGMLERLREGGFLVLGAKDHLPQSVQERHELTRLEYQPVQDWSYGPMEPFQNVFRKGNAKGVNTRDDDPRALAGTYAAFLRTKGEKTDWVLERDRMVRERTMRKLSDRSKAVLERAAREGRRNEPENFTSRMMQDNQARDQRQAARIAEKKAREDEEIATTAKVCLTVEESKSKMQSFYGRLFQDMASRQHAVELAEKQRMLGSTMTKPSKESKRRTRSSKTAARESCSEPRKNSRKRRAKSAA